MTTRVVTHQFASNSQVDDFTLWCRDELFTKEMRIAADLLEHACDLHLISLFTTLQLQERLAKPRTAAELASELHFVDSSSIALDAVLLRLAYRTSLVKLHDDDFNPVTYSAQAHPIDVTAELAEVRDSLIAMGPGYKAAIEFLDFGADHFIEALRDNQSFMDTVLTGRDPRYADLWDRATNSDPLQDAHGAMGSRIVENCFGRGTILEIGAGTGNGTRHLLQRFSDNSRLDTIEQYIFTDVSLAFILRTKQTLKQMFPDVTIDYRHLDINKGFREQKLSSDTLDLIYGVNAAHIAWDTVSLLKECRMALRPGGHVVFAERVRLKPWMAPRELTLNLSEYHRGAAILDPTYRQTHAYLGPSCWQAAFRLAGFDNVEFHPDLKVLGDTFPNQYAAVIVATKVG